MDPQGCRPVIVQLRVTRKVSSVSEESSIKKRRRDQIVELPVDKRRRVDLASSSPLKLHKFQKDTNQKRPKILVLVARPPLHTRDIAPRNHLSLESPPSQPEELDGLDLQEVLDQNPVSLGSNQMKAIYRWMWQHSTCTAKDHDFEFKLLLLTLGFCHPAFSPELKGLLRAKVYEQISQNATELKLLGAVTTIFDKKKKRRIVQFAEWTEGWMSESWDGSPRPPCWTQLFFNPYFGESRGWLHMRVPVPAGKDTDLLVGPETLVVEEPAAHNQPQHESNHAQQSHASKASEARQDLGNISPRTFRYLFKAAQTSSSPSYRVDISELPQYHGVQLTPNDPNHPLRPHPEFVASGQDYYENIDDEEYYDEDDYEDSTEGSQVEDDTMDSDTVC